MAERVEVLGGHVQAGPRPRDGWEVVATIPVPGPDTVAGDRIPSTAERTTGAQQ